MTMRAEDSYERRIATVEANYTTLVSSMQRMEGYMSQLFHGQGEIKTGMALVAQNQGDMKEYQKRCDGERADHEKRITATEGFQSRLVKYTLLIGAAMTGLGSIVSPHLSKLWDKIFS